MYERVTKLDVFLWGRHVGAMAPDVGSSYVFQYDPEFVKSGIEIAPFMLPLGKDAVDLGLGYAALEQLFLRMAFNVYIEDTDDHTKNFSFLRREGGDWELAPAYDLTGYHVSAEDKAFESWVNPHALSVNGKASGIRDEDLLIVAERFGIGTAKDCLARIKAAVRQRKAL